jgi:peptidoglycan/xylan/chitin deacetylase (PgdA/CDA1 family)
MKKIFIFILLGTTNVNVHSQILRKPVPDKLVVLSFDDGPVSHATFVGPLLKKYGFGATFFVCEFPPDFKDKSKYMSWEQMQQLDKMGFEVANHTKNHTSVKKMDSLQFGEELGYIEDKCKELNIRTPLVSFAYPGYTTDPAAIPLLEKRGYQFARTGGDRTYDPEKDNPFLIPSFTVKDTNQAIIKNAFQLAKNGKILVLTIHGVPDGPHPWVTTSPALLEEYMKFLYDNHYKVIAMRQLVEYIDSEKAAKEIPAKF